MSGLGKVIKTSLNPVKAFKQSLHPMDVINAALSPLGDLTGANAAKANAKAIQQQTQAQEQQYQQSLLQTQQANQLGDADTSNVASVTAGGTASDADSALSAQTRKNRQQLISTTLGI